MSVPVPPHYCQTLVLSVFLILYFRYRYVVISHVVLICDPNLNFLIIFNFFYYSLHTSYISFRCTTMLDIYVAYKVITSMSLMPSWYHSYDNITDCSLCGTLRPCDSNWQSVLLNPPPPRPQHRLCCSYRSGSVSEFVCFTCSLRFSRWVKSCGVCLSLSSNITSSRSVYPCVHKLATFPLLWHS